MNRENKGKAKRPEETSPEDREVYCGRLGHFVPLRYCLKPAQETPCFKIRDCWWQIFDIVSYLESNLDKETFEKLMKEASPPNRINTILGIVDDLKKGGHE